MLSVALSARATLIWGARGRELLRSRGGRLGVLHPAGAPGSAQLVAGRVRPTHRPQGQAGVTHSPGRSAIFVFCVEIAILFFNSGWPAFTAA